LRAGRPASPPAPARRARLLKEFARRIGDPNDGGATRHGLVRWHSLRFTIEFLSAASQGDEKTKGGLIIPDTAKEKPAEGEIVAVGAGAKDSGELIAVDVKAGDRILFGKWSGTEVTLDGEELLIMKESDILGIIA
jgi:chaperonin GroES